MSQKVSVVFGEKNKNTPTYIILTLNEAAVFAKDMFRDNQDCWYYLYAKAVDCWAEMSPKMILSNFRKFSIL